MTFFRTEMLLFIWAVPILAAMVLYGQRRRRSILKRFASRRGLAAIAPAGIETRRWIKAGLLLTAMLLLTVTLAGPRYGYRWQKIRQQGVDIIIALDVSRSMTVADIAPSRLERAKREVFDLLAMLQGDRVGLVAFSGTAFLQCPLTLDYSAFNLFLDSLTPEALPVGGTNLTAALQAAEKAFDPQSAADKAVILITDGENTGDGDPIAAAEALKENGITLFCIGVGGSEGVPIPEAAGGFKKDRAGQIVLSRLDEASLKKMAVVTGGTYVRSLAGDMDLEAIYNDEIRGQLAAATVESGRKQIWEDRFQWPLALALVCVVAELLLPVTRKSTLALLLAGLIVLPAGMAQADDTADGIAAYEKGQYQEALRHFTDAQLSDPESPRRLYNVADAYYKTGDYEAAADHYRQVAESDDPELKAKALYNLGNTEFRRGDLQTAIAQYEAALELDPDNQLAKENLAFVKKALEQKQEPPQSGQQEKDDSRKDKKEQEKSPADDAQGPGQNDQQPGDDQPDQARQPQGQQPDEQRQTPQKGEPEPDQEPSGQTADQQQQAGASPTDPGQAQRMLNRLQDQPGKALMPAGGPQRVEKDW